MAITSKNYQYPISPPQANVMRNMRHGLHACKLPESCGWVRRFANEFRRNLEDIVIDRKGEINVVDAASVNTATRWETHALLAARWLRLECDKMSFDQRLNFSREVARASSERDRAIKALGLSTAEVEQQGAPMDVTALIDSTIDEPEPPPPAPPAAPPAPTAE